MFSPYYARARRRSPEGCADPTNHCALNVALYGRGAKRWAMTERGRHQVQCDAANLQIGPSALQWNGDTLTIEIDEITVPWPSRLRGVVRVHAAPRFDHPVLLSERGQHRWFPLAPSARVEVDLSAPGLRWSGPGYLDSNRGDAPLEQAFTRWDWARAHLAEGRSAVVYDVDRSDAPPLAIGLEFCRDGSVNSFESPQRAALPSSLWRVTRTARGEPGEPMRVMQTLTDSPFYARSLVKSRWLGEPVTAMHESLSLRRFDSGWVQALLPFRMPRITR